MTEALLRAVVVALKLNPKQVLDLLVRALGYMALASTLLNTAMDFVRTAIKAVSGI